MACKKTYRIFCQTESSLVYGSTILEDPPNLCPNNEAHAVLTDSKVITEIFSLSNLSAVADPTANDDINLGYDIGSTWINTLTNATFTCVNNAAGASVWNRQLIGFLGNDYNYAESLDNSTTTSDVFQQKLRLSVSVSGGIYHVQSSAEIKTSFGSKNVMSQVQIDDDANKIIGSFDNYNIGYTDFSTMARVELAAGAHTIDLDWKSKSAGTTVHIRNARLEIWRIS